MQVDITPIAEALLALIISIIAVVVLPRVKTWLDARTTKADRENIMNLVKVAVNAAEQLYQSQTGEKLGAKRKEYVMNLLAAQNLNIDYDLLEAMVEDEVRKLNEALVK